tara:strand:- start:425 stop:1528 length:1104 start_codon:yes stop_codon:yes gene_type:complete
MEISSNLQNSYFSLVKKRFLKNRVGILGLVFVGFLIFSAVFADFLSPYDPAARDSDRVFYPPQGIHFFDEENNFSLRPFSYGFNESFDPDTFEPIMETDYSQKNYLYFFTRGWKYNFLGVKLDFHLFTTKDGSKVFFLGSDAYGRDMLSRIFKGSRVTLLFALIVVSITTFIGILVGISSGYFAGKFDIATQRVTELALAFPDLPLYLSLVAILPRQMDPFLIFIFMAFILSSLRWAQLSREVRGKTLSLRRLDYIKAAEALGSNDLRIIYRHLLPNVTSHVIVSVSLLIPSVILTESFFSFLGLGIQSPFVSWGLQLNSAQDLRTIGSYPWVLSPVFAILISVLGFNALGDALRDAIDPYATTTKK